MKNKISVLILLFAIVIPQVALASWWNPFSWNIFNKTSSSINTTIPTATTQAEDQLISKTETQSLISIKFDNTVIKSSLMIKIFDNNQYILQGSGISLGGFGNILTNYHVAEKVLSDPNRYKAYGCVTISLNTVPTCNYLLSPTRKLLSGSTANAQYSKDLDLALLYIDQVKVNGKWLSVIDTSLNDLKDRSINLSSYTKNYHDLAIGSPIYSVGYPDFGDEKTIQVDGTVKEILKDQSSGQVLILSALNISHGNSGGPVFNSKGELAGVTVACLTASPDSEKCKPNSGLFIPLPSVNWWYTQVNNSHIIAWEGKNYYSSNNGIPDDTQKATLCLLENSAHYDSKISTNSCTCNTGYTKNSDNKCVNSSGVADPSKTPYGQPRDPEGEKKTLQMLDNLFSDLKENQTPSTANTNYLNNNYAPSIAKAKLGDEYRNKALYSAADGLKVDATNYLNNAINYYDEALGILGNNPPADWKPSHDCIVSSYNNMRSAAQTLLLGVPYFKVSVKAADYWNEAQALVNKGLSDSACAFNKIPTVP